MFINISLACMIAIVNVKNTYIILTIMWTSYIQADSCKVSKIVDNGQFSWWRTIFYTFLNHLNLYVFVWIPWSRQELNSAQYTNPRYWVNTYFLVPQTFTNIKCYSCWIIKNNGTVVFGKKFCELWISSML